MCENESSTELSVARSQTSHIHTVPSWQSMDVDGPRMETMSVRKVSGDFSSRAPWKRSRELQFRCTCGKRRAAVSLEAYPPGRGRIFSESRKTLGLRIKDTYGLVFDVLLSFQSRQQILTGCVLEQISDETLEDFYYKFVYGHAQARKFKEGQLARIRMKPLPPEDYEGRTSDQVQHTHNLRAQTSVSIKKVGY